VTATASVDGWLNGRTVNKEGVFDVQYSAKTAQRRSIIMQKRELGESGIEVSAMGLGCFANLTE